MQLDVRPALQWPDFLGRQVAYEIELAGAEPLNPHDGAGDVTKDDPIEIWLSGFPVVRISLDRDVAPLQPFLENKRPGADRIIAEVLPEFLCGGRRNHEAGTFAEQAQETRRTLLEIECDRRSVDHLDRADDRVKLLALRRGDFVV